jgi:hypothetical protein
VAPALRQAARGSSSGTGQRSIRGVLVIGEVALALMLLVGASLMLRTLFATCAPSTPSRSARPRY